MKRFVWALFFCAFAPVPEAVAAEDPSPAFIFAERFIDCVHQIRQGAELDKGIVAIFADFHQESDLYQNVEFQTKIQALAIRQKDFFEKAMKTLETSADPEDSVQKLIFQNASEGIFGLLLKNQMFSDVLLGRKDHSREDFVRTEREGWERLSVAARHFPFLVSEKPGSEKMKKGTIPYKISKEQRASLLQRLDQNFGKAKPEMVAEIRAGNKDRKKETPILSQVVVRLYESLQFDTYQQYKSKAVTDAFFALRAPSAAFAK